MIISIIGSVHQKCTPEVLQQLLETLIQGSEGHRLRIDTRFFDYLWHLGIKLPQELSSNVRQNPAHTDVLVSLGGDGTFLRAAKLIAGTQATILGVNTGRLGFLAGTRPSEVSSMWSDIINGYYETEVRSMLEVWVEKEGHTTYLEPALNEIAILKRDTASMIGVFTKINGEEVATFEGDGLLIATPTGSTAYSLSVGGPIVHPESPVLILAPVAPHMLNMRPLVVPDHSPIEMQAISRNDTILLSSDGRSTPIDGAAKIFVKRSDKSVRIVRHPIHTFYDTLRQKLMWGQAMRSEDPVLK